MFSRYKFRCCVILTGSEWYEAFQSVVSHITARQNASAIDLLLAKIAKG